jgi:flagellar P-ring protein precursor FlgI
MLKRFAIGSLSAFVAIFLASDAFSARIKDIATIAGVRDNQLVGYGLIVGLDGTGDKTGQAPFTDQAFQNMLLEFGINIQGAKSSQLKNVAAVALSATLPPFIRVGQKIDITVSSLGNATSLRGGSLLMTPLKGADGKVYAMAQGSIVVSGFGTQGADGSKVTVNSMSSGSIPNGATVEKEIDMPYAKEGYITFQLTQPDFTTAERIEQVINHEFGHKVASALDASSVRVNVKNVNPISNFESSYKDEPQDTEFNEQTEKSRYVPLISRIENIELRPAEIGARVIVNSRTGTIVIGRNVTLSPVAVSHGNLSVIVTEKPYVSQPQGFSQGKTVKGTASNISITMPTARTFVFAPGPSLNDLVEAINRVGAAPGDLIAILEAINAAGALHADLEVI